MLTAIIKEAPFQSGGRLFICTTQRKTGKGISELPQKGNNSDLK